MTIRDLSLSDLDAVTAIDRVCFPPPVAFPRELFEECLDRNDTLSLGIERDGRLAAFAVINRSGPSALQIITIDVLPEFRRQGLADALMQEAMAAARANGIKRIVLQAAVDNDPAIALYKKWGFRIKAVLPDYYGQGKDAFLMDREIGEK
ncbi:MAG TPA: GNAT family N-acetyltransferase [bacterium]|nr:GNAT family N-acetyltransferase [bacterium]